MGLFVPQSEASGSLTRAKVKEFVSRPCFSTKDIIEVTEKYGGISEQVLADYVGNPDNEDELKSMLSNIYVPTALQKAALLSQMTGQRAEELGFGMSIDTGSDFTVGLFSPDWNLCNSSEDRLQSAIENRAVVSAGSGLLVKFEGRLTALCYKSFATKRGTFLEGNWYSPVDRDLRDSLLEAHDTGDPRPDLSQGRWLLIRGKDYRYPNLISASRDIAENLPDRLAPSIEGRDRRTFRRENEESYEGNTENLACF